MGTLWTVPGDSKKSKVMCIKPRGSSQLYVPRICLNGLVMDVVDRYKYLGFELTDDMSDDNDIKRQIRSLYSRGNLIIKCFKHCTDEVKLLLFKTYCTNLYCAHLWSSYSKSIYNKLKVSYNRIFRILMHVGSRESISMAMLYSNVNAFDITVRKYILGFKSRLEYSDNLILTTLLQAFKYPTSLLYKQWQTKLYVL